MAVRLPSAAAQLLKHGGVQRRVGAHLVSLERNILFAENECSNAERGVFLVCSCWGAAV